jgi:hypothetical protein
MNDTNVYSFYGPDVIDGQVEGQIRICGSNKLEEATNNGWPTFWNLVVVAGNVCPVLPSIIFPWIKCFKRRLIKMRMQNSPAKSSPLPRQTFITEAEFVGLQTTMII